LVIENIETGCKENFIVYVIEKSNREDIRDENIE